VLLSKRRRPRAAFLICAVACLGVLTGSPEARAEEIIQYFPVTVRGEPPAKRESGWRINWRILPTAKDKVAQHGYGRAAVWELQGIDYMKGYRPDGSEDWVRILNRMALAEMYVPYNQYKQEFFDITNYDFHMTRPNPSFFPKAGIVSARIHADGVVASEIVDDHVRWIDNNHINQRGEVEDKVLRGQVLVLWATFFSENYRYVLRYGFSDDGTISVRVGGTAENFFQLYDKKGVSHDYATHLHMGGWRMEFNLGNPRTNTVEMIERDHDQSGRPFTNRRPFNNGREGGEIWDPTKFSVLRITSGQTKNRAEPPRLIAYTLKPVRSGSVRTKQDFTKADFWVSRLQPDDPARVQRGLELRFIDVAKNVLPKPEPLQDRPVVIWHQTGLNHIVRNEDYGVSGRKEEGAAINSWTGFDLVPSNLWHRTPFLDRSEAMHRRADDRPHHTR
jgi:Cu2+-containing amine oxidase